MHAAYTFRKKTNVEVTQGSVELRDDQENGVLLFGSPEDLLRMGYAIIEALDPNGEYPDHARILNAEVSASCEKIF